jgi:hypothetical protein
MRPCQAVALNNKSINFTCQVNKKYGQFFHFHLEGYPHGFGGVVLVLFDRSEVSTLMECVRLLLKLIFVSNFSIFRTYVFIVSLLCDLTWYLVPVWGSKAKYFYIVFAKEII